LVPYPTAVAPVEIDVSHFVDSEASRGTRLAITDQGKAAVLDGGAASSGGQLAIPYAKVPTLGAQGKIAVAAQVDVRSPAIAFWETGAIEGDWIGSTRWSTSVIQQGTRDWYHVRDFDPQDPNRKDGFAMLRQKDGDAVTGWSLSMNRSAVFPRTFGASGIPPFGQVAWSPDGSRLWGIFDNNRQLAAWDAGSLSVVATWDGGMDRVAFGATHIHGLAVGNQFAICATDSGLVRVFSATGKGRLEPLAAVRLENAEFAGTVLSKNELWTILSSVTGIIEIRSVPQLELLHAIPRHPLAVRSISLGKHDQLLATGCDDGWVRLFYLDGPQQVRPWIKLDLKAGPVDRVKLSADGRFLAVATRSAISLAVWDLAALKQAFAMASETIAPRPPLEP
jgi:WD40 repeat protein